MVAHLECVNFVTGGCNISAAIKLLDVDGVLDDDTVGLLRVLPADQDGIVRHGQSLDR